MKTRAELLEEYMQYSPKKLFDDNFNVYLEDDKWAIEQACSKHGCVAVISLVDVEVRQKHDLADNLARTYIFHTLDDRKQVHRRDAADWFSHIEPSLQDVYFIQCGFDGPIKIGVAKSTIDRLSELQTASPFKLRILATIPGGGKRIESALHSLFSSVRTFGEWFFPSKELLAFINREATEWRA